MTQMVVTIENGADTDFLRRMIQNMKGVLDVSLRNSRKKIYSNGMTTDEWIDSMKDLSNSVDASVVDWNDERTRHIMSR